MRQQNDRFHRQAVHLGSSLKSLDLQECDCTGYREAVRHGNATPPVDRTTHNLQRCGVRATVSKTRAEARPKHRRFLPGLSDGMKWSTRSTRGCRTQSHRGRAI